MRILKLSGLNYGDYTPTILRVLIQFGQITEIKSNSNVLVFHKLGSRLGNRTLLQGLSGPQVFIRDCRVPTPSTEYRGPGFGVQTLPPAYHRQAICISLV